MSFITKKVINLLNPKVGVGIIAGCIGYFFLKLSGGQLMYDIQLKIQQNKSVCHPWHPCIVHCTYICHHLFIVEF